MSELWLSRKKKNNGQTDHKLETKGVTKTTHGKGSDLHLSLMNIVFTVRVFTCYNPHEQVSAGSGLAPTRRCQPLQCVEGVEVDKVGAAETGDDWKPASVQRQTGSRGGESLKQQVFDYVTSSTSTLKPSQQFRL